jgi:hypothetical protein
MGQMRTHDLGVRCSLVPVRIYLLQGGLAVTVISIVAMLIILYQDGVR